MILSRIASILLYFFIFFSIILLSYLSRRTRKPFFAIVAIFIPAIFVALRFRVGTDTEGYVQMFNEVSSMDFSQIVSKIISFGIEPFAIFVIKLINLLRLDCFFFFFVFSLLTFAMLFVATNNIAKNSSWLLFSACSIIVLPLSINIMRQGAAIAIIFASISSLLIGRKKLAFALFAFAFTVHFSTIVLLPVLFLEPFLKKYGLKHSVFISLIILVFLLFAVPRLLPFIIDNELLPQKYLDTFSSFSSNLMNFDFLFFCILAFLLLITRQRANSYSDRVNRFFTVLVLAGVCYSGMGFFSAYLGRFSDFFWPFVIIASWLLIDRFEDNQRFKQTVFICVTLFYFTITTIVMGNSELIPYGLSI